MSSDNGHPDDDGDYYIEWVSGQPPDQMLDCGCWVRYTPPEHEDGITTSIVPCHFNCPDYLTLLEALVKIGPVELRPLP